MEKSDIYEENNLSLDEISSFIRYVNPITKRIHKANKIEEFACSDMCFMFLGRKKPCENCIAIRAINENSMQIKVEYNANKLYMVTAYSFSKYKQKYVAEMFVNITDAGLIEAFQDKLNYGVGEKIQCVNEGLVRDNDVGIYNRRFIYERLPYDIYLNNMQIRSMLVLVVDIEAPNFIDKISEKEDLEFLIFDFVNVLTKLIDFQTDWIARYEKNKFIVILNKSCREDLDEASEKLINVIEDFKAQGISEFEKVNFNVSLINENITDIDMIFKFLEINYKS